MDKYYVYVLMDSSKKGKYIYNDLIFEYEPFYIGKGCGDRIKNTIYDKSKFKSNKINKLKSSNIKIISEKIFDNLSNEEAIIIEKRSINDIGRRDLKLGTLVNATDGGDGGRLNSKHSDEVKLKISKSRKNKGVGWTHSTDTLKFMSDAQSGVNNNFYGMTHSDEVKNYISLINSGKNHPMYNKRHNNETREIMKQKRKNLDNSLLRESCQIFNKEVIQYSLDMDFIREYKSVKDASIGSDINESIISKCCRGDILNPTRYFFKYSDNESKIKNNKFLIGGKFKHGKVYYEVIKRNKSSAICLNLNDNTEETIRYKDMSILIKKDTNNSDFIELYLFLSKYGKYKINKKDLLIYNDNLIIHYNKLLNSSELFLDKKEIFNRYDDNFRVINIFEDYWLNKKNIVKSRLLNLLGNSDKIYARKCDIRKVEYKDKKEFLIENHIQGDVRSKLNLGLYCNDKLVSLMTFGSLRKNLGQVSKEGSYELLRFCNVLNTSVVGGASKLFKHFLNNNEVNNVISYADRCWSNGNLYKMLNFTRSSNKIIPNYYYIVDGIRKNRFNYRKDILVSDGFDINLTEIQIQNNRGYYRIFDCGSFKYEFSQKN